MRPPTGKARWFDRLYFVKQQAAKGDIKEPRNRAEWRSLARSTRRHGDGRERNGGR